MKPKKPKINTINAEKQERKRIRAEERFRRSTRKNQGTAANLLGASDLFGTGKTARTFLGGSDLFG
jgi:hypothetical protein